MLVSGQPGRSLRSPTVCLSVRPRLLPANALLLAAPGPQDSAQFECVASNEVGEARRLYRVTVLGESEPREKRDVVTPLCPVCAPPVRLCTWADVSRFPLGTARPAWTTSCRRPSLIPPYPR